MHKQIVIHVSLMGVGEGGKLHPVGTPLIIMIVTFDCYENEEIISIWLQVLHSLNFKNII